MPHTLCIWVSVCVCVYRGEWERVIYHQSFLDDLCTWHELGSATCSFVFGGQNFLPDKLANQTWQHNSNEEHK